MLREVDIRFHNFLCFLTFRKSIVLVQLATLIYAIRSQTFIKDFLLRVSWSNISTSICNASKNLQWYEALRSSLGVIRRISLEILSEFKGINQLLFPLKSSGNLRIAGELGGNNSRIEVNSFALITFFKALQRNAKNVWTSYFYDIRLRTKVFREIFQNKKSKLCRLRYRRSAHLFSSREEFCTTESSVKSAVLNWNLHKSIIKIPHYVIKEWNLFKVTNDNNRMSNLLKINKVYTFLYYLSYWGWTSFYGRDQAINPTQASVCLKLELKSLKKVLNVFKDLTKTGTACQLKSFWQCHC